ncbi:hypothetical protein ACTNEM_06695 [Eubacterium pyruvativorans]|uniref:hypothetical protein n=1 Tax=Eubacterium pyruvativorans TaxID=155865 RepID=UPI003F8BB6A6
MKNSKKYNFTVSRQGMLLYFRSTAFGVFLDKKIRIFARGTTAFLLLSNMDGFSTMSVVE